MKKLITNILLIITLTTAICGQIVYAENDDTPVLIAGYEDYEVKPTTIPRPQYLPGPTKAQQEEDGNTNVTILRDKLIPKVTVGLISIVGGIALLFVIIGGVRFMISFGNDEDIKKAKDQVVYGLAGFMISLLSYTIVKIIINIKFK